MRPKTETLTSSIVLESHVESVFSELHKPELGTFQMCKPGTLKIIIVIIFW